MKTKVSRKQAIGPFRTVLVTTDFSELGDAALDYLGALTSKRCRIVLVNVQHPRSLPNARYELELWSPASLAMHRFWIRECLRKLKRRASRVPARPRIEPVVVEAEEVPEAICAAAERYDADAICIASHGYSGWRAGLMGSVTRSVLSDSRRPVLVVRPREKDA